MSPSIFVFYRRVLMNNNLIITRFTHGSAGKFLSTVLQTSKYVDHWSSVVQHQKELDELYEQTTIEYVKRSFPKDHSLHMLSEPMVPYNTSLYSTGYPRGNNVTYNEYCSQVDNRMDICKSKQLLANIVFHKPNIPLFCKNSRTVTIMTTSKREQEWVHSTLWSKQFLETEEEIIKLDLSPDHCSFSSLPNILKYNPEYKFSLANKEQIFEKFVVGDHCASWYTDYKFFTEFDKTLELNNMFVDLENFFNVDRFVNSIIEIFSHFDLGTVNIDLIKSMHKIWLSRQHAY
jgi:hypothetical protein